MGADSEGHDNPQHQGGHCDDPRMETLDYTLTKLDSRSLDSWPAMELHHPYSSRGTLLHGYGTDKGATRCRTSQVCRAAVVLLVLLLLAWGIAVPLYFVIGPGLDLYRGRGLAVGIVEGNGDGESIMNGTVLNSVNASMVIANQRYSRHLGNHFSSEYQALRLKLETLLSVVFNKNTEFNKAAVTRFRPHDGATQVDFVLIFHKNQPQVRALVEAALLNYLAKHWSMLGKFQIDVSTVKIKYIRNQCAVDNGGCSHLCFWSMLTAGYECRCPQSYQLLGDKKTCFPSLLPKVTSTSNPCGEGNFACRSGSCIPHHWLCDGVSDCLLGEDEAHKICKPSSDSDEAEDEVVDNFTTEDGRFVHNNPHHTTMRSLPTERLTRPTTADYTTTPRLILQRKTSADPSRDFTIPSLATDISVREKELLQLQKSKLRGRPDKFKYFG